MMVSARTAEAGLRAVTAAPAGERRLGEDRLRGYLATTFMIHSMVLLTSRLAGACREKVQKMLNFERN